MIKYLFTSISLILFSVMSVQAAVLQRAPTSKKMGPAGKPFINGATGHTSHLNASDVPVMARRNVNGLRFWLSVYDFQDPMGNEWTRNSISILKSRLKTVKNAGFHIFLTIAISKYEKNGVPYGFYFKGDPKQKKNWHSNHPTAEQVERGTRIIAAQLKGLVDDIGALNEPGHKDYWPNGTGEITKSLHYTDRFLIPMTRAIRSVDKSIQVFASVPWCGAYAAHIHNQLFNQILARVKTEPNALPDGFDCHAYKPSASMIAAEVGFFRKSMESFSTKIHAMGKTSFKPQLAISEFNCKASPLKHLSTGKEGPVADKCIKEVYSGALIKLVDQAYYFIFYPYLKRPFDDILNHRGPAFQQGTDFLFK